MDRRPPLDVALPPLDVAFEVALPPMGAPRPRFSSVSGRIATHMPSEYTSHVRHFAALAAPWRPREVIGQAVGVDLLVVFPRLKRDDERGRDGALKTPERRWHVNVPDVDNVAKLVLDAMRAWWADDRLVVGLRVVKVVAAPGEQSRYFVRVRDAAAWMQNRGKDESD